MKIGKNRSLTRDDIVSLCHQIDPNEIFLEKKREEYEYEKTKSKWLMIYRHVNVPKQMSKLRRAIDKGYSKRNDEEQVRKDEEYERYVEQKKLEKLEQGSSGHSSPVRRVAKKVTTMRMKAPKF